MEVPLIWESSKQQVDFLKAHAGTGESCPVELKQVPAKEKLLMSVETKLSGREVWSAQEDQSSSQDKTCWMVWDT